MTPTQRAMQALSAVADAYRADGTELCVTFSMPDDPEGTWIQVTWNHLNMSYPRAEKPTLSLPPAFQLVAWERGAYVTYTHDGGMDAVAFLVGYAEVVLGQPLDGRWAREDMEL